MTLTEDEAKKRWCPEARVYSSSGSYNRPAGESRPAPGARCLGSECMAWVWRDPVGAAPNRTGYCGKAGRPA